MHHIIYMSRESKPMTDEQLRELLVYARQANEQAGITGALVYGEGQFMQIIEGDEARLALLYAKLLNDPRHQSVVKLADKQIAQRSFADWSMGFQPISGQDFSTLAGYVLPAELQVQRPGLSEADALLLNMMKSFILLPFTGATKPE